MVVVATASSGTPTTQAISDASTTESPGPAWRSFPFFKCVPIPSRSSDRSEFASYPTSRVFSIEKLSFWPKGVTDGTASATDETANPSSPGQGASSSSSSSSSSRQRDFPYLLILRSGQLILVDPTTLAPLTLEFSTTQSNQRASITHALLDAPSGKLVVLSEDEGGAGFPLLQVFDLQINLATLRQVSPSGSSWRPRLLAESRVQHGRKPFPIAALATTPGLSYLACSLSSGAVLLLRNLSAALDGAPAVTSSPGPAIVMPKFKVVYQPGVESGTKSAAPLDAQEPVTALGFSFAAHAGTSASTLHLFIANLTRVMRYTVLGKGAGNTPVTLDDIGAPLDCSVLIPPLASGDSPESTSEAKLLIARPEALYIIGSNGREMCYAYEGQKAKVSLLPSSGQLVLFSPPMQSTQASNSATVRRFAANGQATGSGGVGGGVGLASNEATKVSIFDLRGKFLSYTGMFPGAIQATFVDGMPTASRYSGSSSSSSGREDLFLLSESGAINRLEEKPLRDKLDLLFARSLYILASQVARSHFPTASVQPEALARLNALLAEIWVKYGDHLYEKGDYEGSMKMGYLKSVSAAAGSSAAGRAAGRHGRISKNSGTGGGLRAGIGESYIIRRFLDAQRIPLLTQYLQELHRRGLANPDHTTLLLNCFTKMKDTEALDRFIRRSHVVTASDGEDEGDDGDADETLLETDALDDDLARARKQDRLPFDLSTAIRVCRSANYFAQAAYLAKKFDLGEEYLRIKIEDTNFPLDALDWLRTREAGDVEQYLKLYAGRLLAGGSESEEKTTDLLIELCSGAYRPHLSNSVSAIEQAAKAAQNRNKQGEAGGMLRYLTGNNSSADRDHAAPPYEINGDAEASTKTQKPVAAEDGTGAEVLPPYEAPLPRAYFTHFLRFPASFRRFLETVALARWGQSIIESDTIPEADVSPAIADELDIEEDDMDEEVREQRAVWNTLLEIYLRAGRQEKSDQRRALRLLQQHAELPYDASHALVLCEQESFTEGIVLLYERLSLYEDVLRLWMDKSLQQLEAGSSADETTASDHVLKALDRYAGLEPSLYSLVLTHLISHPALLSRYSHEVQEILVRVEEEKLMSTLQIVQLLSKTRHANVGLVKSFLQRSVEEERSEIEADQRLIESYRSEAENKTREVEALTSAAEPRVFQSNRCNACGGQLDLPAVHFMCKHSYHGRCLGEGENECPACAASYGVVREIRRNNEELASRHDL